MPEGPAPLVKLPPVQQIGVVVEDMDRAIAHYARFGWGPFQVHEFENKGVTCFGVTTDCRMKIAFYNSGPVEIELIQVLEGDTPHTRFLEQRGEGIQHLRFEIDGLQDILKKLAPLDIKPIFNHTYREIGIDFAYLDTDVDGGVIMELIEIAAPGGGR